MAKKLHQNKVVLVILILVAAGLVLAAFYLKNNRAKTLTASGPNVTNNRPTSADAETEAIATTPTSTSQTTGSPTVPVSLPKPTLSKSSGNNGSVPAGAPIEFTCKGQPGLQCTLVLTNKSNAANKIDLGAKTIKDDGYGQTSVSWNWNSIAGSWSVVAQVTDGKGNSALSDEQSLVVQ